ncbi:MAG: hypothetical protein ACYC21_14525 [Eubacteriales bacterium]
MNYEPGMLLAFRWDSNTYGVCKVLKITETRKDPIINIVTYANWFENIPEDLDFEQLKPLVVHMPMILSGLTMSDCTPIGKVEVKPEELEGYENWNAAWKDRRAGFFERSISDAVDHVMEAMAQVDNGGQDSVYRERLMRQWQNNRM